MLSIKSKHTQLLQTLILEENPGKQGRGETEQEGIFLFLKVR